jgi:DNA-binding beta-propeller fold protein YncE
MHMRWLIALSASLAGCGATDIEGAPGGDWGVGDAGTVGCVTSNECAPGFYCSEFGYCLPLPGEGPGDGGMPPEEVEYALGEPITSSRYIYVAMTEQDELVRIDGQTLAVRSTQVGEAPEVVVAIPGTDGVIVLDSHNGTATIVRPAGELDEKRVLPTLQNLNRLDVDPSGRYAVAWFDLAKQIRDGGLGGIGSFQDVTLIALAPGLERAVDLTVGFRPRDIKFDAQGRRAYVITEDGVSVIDMGYALTHGPSIVPPIAVADPMYSPETAEVDIEATGTYAAVRQSGAPTLRIVDVGGLEPGRVWELPLASPATDIDLAPDGSRLYVVQRDARVLSIVDVPADVHDPAGVETIDLSNASVGSLVLSVDGTRALMFTNATADERISLLRLDEPGTPYVTWPLKKAVRAVGISPSGTTAIVLHAKMAGDPATATNVEEYIDRSYGYSLVDLTTGFAKLQITPVDPGPFAYAPDGRKAYVALDGGDDVTAPRALQIVTTQTGVVVEKQLGSPPAAVGILPGAGQAFAAQRHPLGRVTFVDLATDAVRTLTGFDLNSNIVH